MAKTKARETLEVLELEYHLQDLPTAQHKAGLAGLAMMVNWLGPNGKRLLQEECEIDEHTARFRFTEQDLGVLFDCVYAGKPERVESSTQWKGKAPLEEVFVKVAGKNPGELREEKRFVYEIVQPRFQMLEDYFTNNQLWVKLWREMCWATTRAVPKTRLPYERTADGNSSGVAQEEWSSLVREYFGQQNGLVCTKPVSGSVFVGAQATNAENLSFEGFPKQNFLLHFWIFSILVFCPRNLGKDGKIETRGFLLAFPEVCDLKGFLQDYRGATHFLSQNRKAVGIRPSAALLDVAAESALQFAGALSSAAPQKSGHLSSVSSVEYYHLEKQGNSLKGLEVGKVLIAPARLNQYGELTKKRFHSYLFRRGVIRAVLNDTPWYSPFLSSLVDTAEWMFLDIYGGGPKGNREGEKFARDCRKQFHNLLKRAKGGRRIVASKSESKIELIVYKMVGDYLKEKTQAATGERWDDFPKDEKGRRPSEHYRERRAHLGRALFLEIRSRRADQFIEYFASTLGSVKQYISRQNFLALTQHLRSQPDDVKTLTLLAISAHS